MGSDSPAEYPQAWEIYVSIHAPVWGATLHDPPTIKRYVEFQSTLPYGERHLFACNSYFWVLFQSTLPYGERLSVSIATHNKLEFQSTLPYGERQHRFAIQRFRQSFNPRSRMGSDKCGCCCARIKEVSIHAPVWGATDLTILLDHSSLVSIHAPVWGATCCCMVNSSAKTFQSTLPYGERR